MKINEDKWDEMKLINRNVMNPEMKLMKWTVMKWIENNVINTEGKRV